MLTIIYLFLSIESVPLNMLRAIKDFEYFAPSTLSEAISLLGHYKHNAKIFAGGTDLLIGMKKRDVNPQVLIDIKNISKLDYIRYKRSEGLKIGALATHSSIANSPIISEKYKLLKQASLSVGSLQTRNRGTMVGNICNASPSADTLPALIALNAKLKVFNIEGKKIVNIEEFIKGPFRNILKENEIISEIQIPKLPPLSSGVYLNLSKITKEDETLVGVAVVGSMENMENRICKNVRIGLGSVSPIPMRATKAEKYLTRGKMEDASFELAAEIASTECSPRSRAEYRREMVKILVKRSLTLVLDSILCSR